MITKEEFSAALDVVEAYQKQLHETLSTAERRARVPIREFLERVDVSQRVQSALYEIMELGRGREIYVDEIAEFHFIRLRNTGRLSWREFSEKRDRYIRERQQ